MRVLFRPTGAGPLVAAMLALAGCGSLESINPLAEATGTSAASGTGAGPGGTGGAATGAGGQGGAAEALPVADFSLIDVNPSSSTYDQPVSPRDYLQRVSAWYFGHAT